MLRSIARLSAGLVLLAAAGSCLHGSNTPSPAALPPELQAELDALRGSVWHPSGSLRGSVGWRDNVLLSPFAPIERAFGRAEVEAMLLRPMRERWEFITFVNGDVLRYFSPPPETHGEQQWALHAEGRWQPVAPLRLALKAAGYVRDQVVDLSETEAQRVVAPTRVQGGYAAATLRLALPWGFRLEPLAQVRRSDYRAYAGDYDEVRGGARLEWRGAQRLVLSAAWFEVQRDYRQRVQFTAGGRALPGTQLEFEQKDGEVRARTSWTGAGEWSATLAAGWLENRDGASGYFDYDQRRARLELGWERNGWRAQFDGQAKRLEYLGQTVGAGLAPPQRIADDFEAALRLERDWAPGWTWFAEHRWERSRSNEREFSYRMQTALAGVQWSF